MLPDEKIVAQAVRVETDLKTGELLLVFRVTDEEFKTRILRDWSSDPELELRGKNLQEKK